MNAAGSPRPTSTLTQVSGGDGAPRESAHIPPPWKLDHERKRGLRARVRMKSMAHNSGPRPKPRPALPIRQTHLPALIAIIYEPPEVKHHVPREGLQLLWGHVWNLQPLQVKHVLLVVGHLRAHTGPGLQRLGREQLWGGSPRASPTRPRLMGPGRLCHSRPISRSLTSATKLLWQAGGGGRARELLSQHSHTPCSHVLHAHKLPPSRSFRGR